MANLNIEDSLVPPAGARLLARSLSWTGAGARRSPTLVFLHEGLGNIAR